MRIYNRHKANGTLYALVAGAALAYPMSREWRGTGSGLRCSLSLWFPAPRALDPALVLKFLKLGFNQIADYLGVAPTHFLQINKLVE